MKQSLEFKVIQDRIYLEVSELPTYQFKSWIQNLIYWEAAELPTTSSNPGSRTGFIKKSLNYLPPVQILDPGPVLLRSNWTTYHQFKSWI